MEQEKNELHRILHTHTYLEYDIYEKKKLCRLQNDDAKHEVEFCNNNNSQKKHIVDCCCCCCCCCHRCHMTNAQSALIETI